MGRKKVEIARFTSPIKVGTKGNGVEFQVYVGSAHKGTFIVTSSRVEWCSGKTQEGNGLKLEWDALAHDPKNARFK